MMLLSNNTYNFSNMELHFMLYIVHFDQNNKSIIKYFFEFIIIISAYRIVVY